VYQLDNTVYDINDARCNQEDCLISVFTYARN